MTKFVLFAHPDSGHSYKVALALALLRMTFRYEYVDLTQPRELRRRDFAHASPFGEIPVLLCDGLPLAQSNAILMKLARDTGQLSSQEDLVAQWLFWEANRIGYSVPNLRFLLRFAQGDQPTVEGMLKERSAADLDHLDNVLGRSDFLLGSAATIVDISCCAYLFYGDETGLDLGEWANVASWLLRIAALPGWQAPYDLLHPSRAGRSLFFGSNR